nr:unnamed protein product [Callosobruchus chinensis]
MICVRSGSKLFLGIVGSHQKAQLYV